MNNSRILAFSALLVCSQAFPAAAAVLDYSQISQSALNEVTATGSDGTQFTFSSPTVQFQTLQNAFGVFPSTVANSLLAGESSDTPIALTFSRRLSSISLGITVSQSGNFTSTLQLFNGNVAYAPITLGGDNAGGNFAPAPIFSANGPFDRAIISVTSDFSTVVLPGFPYSADIGPITYSVAAVPLPPALSMFGAAILCVGLLGSRKKLKDGAAV